MSRRAFPVRASAIAVAVLAAAAGGVWVHFANSAPIDDPTYFCDASTRALNFDPAPAPSLTATVVLRDCPDAPTVQLARDQTVAVDLVAYDHGVDSYTKWDDVTVTDERVLSRVRGPERVRVPPPAGNFSPWRVDEVAIYQAAGRGEATLSAVEHFCRGGPMAGCDQGHRWNVTVSVT